MKINVKITRKENTDYFQCAVGDTVEVEFEEYVAAVVASELASGGMEACKAQAVAARTFAAALGVLNGKTISDSSSTAQAYRAKRYDEALYPTPVQAARTTAGEILTYKGKPINAVYSASNGGRTVSASERWGSPRDYLISQVDPWDAATGRPKQGHGVGMSQVGARYAGAHGHTYREILQFYYPHTTLCGGNEVNTLILNDKAKQVIELAQSQMGSPYVFGAIGEMCTPSTRGRRQNSAHPTIKSKCQVLTGKKSSTDPDCCRGCQYDGKHMFDCRGFTYWCLHQVGVDISTVGATTQYKRTQDWLMQGAIAEMPNVVCCVFKHDSATGKMAHTGLHIGNGEIIHCSKDVQTGNISDKSWTHYAIPKGLYTLEEIGKADKPEVSVTLRKGSRGDAVKELQEMLTALGYACGVADGIFGAKTESAVKQFQTDKGLTADGVVGAQTQAAMSERSPVAPESSTIVPEAEDEQEPTQTEDGSERVLVALDRDTLYLLYYTLKAAVEGHKGGESNG